MEKKLVILLMIFFAIRSTELEAKEFDLTIEEIIDSSSFIEKIKQPNNQLYPYFSQHNGLLSRNDIVNIVNKHILPSTDFAFRITNFSELKNNEKFENTISSKQNEIMVRNRDLLSELFPDEIASRNKETIKQTFGLNVPLQKIDELTWMKAEIFNFLNEILSNENVLENWETFKMFFDTTVEDELIKRFTDELRIYKIKKIPINAIIIQKIKNENMIKLSITDKDGKKQNDLFVVTLISGKKWKICKIDT